MATRHHPAATDPILVNFTANDTSCASSFEAETSSMSASLSKREIAFIDPGVDDVVTLLNGMRPDVEPILLNDYEPAPRQMARAVQGREGLEAIHVIAHGRPGEVSFSAGALNAVNLPSFREDLAIVGKSVSGTISLWSCATAVSDDFIEGLQSLTGRPVYGAVGEIGSTALGPNWRLTGYEQSSPLTVEAQAAFNGVLAITAVAFNKITTDSGSSSTDLDTSDNGSDGSLVLGGTYTKATGGTDWIGVWIRGGEFGTTWTWVGAVQVANGTGAWSFDLASSSVTSAHVLDDGTYTVGFSTATTSNGTNSGTPTALTSFIIDTTAPTAGTLSLSNYSDSGSSSADFNSTDKAFDLSLSGNADTNGTTVVYQVSTNGGGTWSTTTAAQSNLTDGSYQFRAVVSDPAGNSSTSNVVTVVVDTTAPTAGTLSLSSYTDSGSSSSDFNSTDKAFDLSLTGNADTNGTTVVYQVSTNGGGTWSTTTAAQSNLTDGSYQFRAVVSDPAGNSATSNVVTVVVDNTAPTAGTLSLSSYTDSGSSSSDFNSTDKAFDLSLSGNADTNGTTVVYQVSTNGGGTWSTTTAAQSNLADGSYQFRAVVSDPAGNSSTSNVVTVVIDTSAPTAGTLSLSNYSDSGSSSVDFNSTDKAFDLSLSGNADTNGTTVVYQVSTNGGGAWSTTTAAQSNLTDGSYQFRAVVSDPAGNSSTSNVVTVVVDTTAPTAGTLSLSSYSDSGSSSVDFNSTDKTFDLSLSGNADTNGTTVVYQVSTNGGGAWSTTTAAQSNLTDG
ncbi:Ig-like domain-containing protein, partial [Bradyrhizobium sp. 14AA]